jgi:serpin B
MRSGVPLLALSLLAACDPPAPPSPVTTAPPVASTPAPTQAATAPTATSRAAEPSPASFVPKAPLPSTEDQKAMAKGNNAFAADLYGKIRSQKGNLAFSPLSVTTALTMTWAGARGDTAAQMKKVLHLEGTPEHALDAAGALVASYGAADNKVTIRVANRLFGDKAYTFDKAYLGRLEADFGAPLLPVDFRKAPDDARRAVNDWVAHETRDRVKDLIPPNGVTPDTRLVLANAIYFLGEWATPFEPVATQPAAFHATATTSRDVPTMHEEVSLHFAALDGVKVLDLPYKNGALALGLVLPDAVDGLGAVEARLGAEAIDKWFGALKTVKVDVALPKFEISPPESLALGDMLQAMGMPLAFDRGKADFTGIAGPSDPAERLCIGQVFHKAFVKVDEKGTEAAAATAVEAMAAGAAPMPEPVQEFKADHPFLFFLRDVRSGMILFMGRVNDPVSK